MSNLDEERLVTAMCLWEAARSNALKDHPLFDEGVVEARYAIAPLVDQCVEEWREIEKKGPESIEHHGPYDLNFCHDFLVRNIDKLV